MTKKVIGFSILAIVVIAIVYAGLLLLSIYLADKYEPFNADELVKVHTLAKTDCELNNDKWMQNSKVKDRYAYLCCISIIAKRADCVYMKDGEEIEYIIIQGSKGNGFNIFFDDSYMRGHTNVNLRDLYIFVKTDSWDVYEEVVHEAYGDGGGFFLPEINPAD